MVIRLKRMSNEAAASFTATKSWSKSSVETILALAAPVAGFKKCCLRSGRFDGSQRDYYF
jgi:hypothetical protein